MGFTKKNKTILAVTLVGLMSVIGVFGQNGKGKRPGAVKNPAPPVATGTGVGGAPSGVGGANGSGVGVPSGGGVGAANGSSLMTAPSGIVILSPSSSNVFRKRTANVNASDINLGRGIGASTGSGVAGEATGNGVGSANDARPAFFNPTPKRDYIKELDGACFYVTNQGEKRYVAKAKCVIE